MKLASANQNCCRHPKCLVAKQMPLARLKCTQWVHSLSKNSSGTSKTPDTYSFPRHCDHSIYKGTMAEFKRMVVENGTTNYNLPYDGSSVDDQSDSLKNIFKKKFKPRFMWIVPTTLVCCLCMWYVLWEMWFCVLFVRILSALCAKIKLLQHEKN